MSTKEQKVKVDADYSLMPVPGHARRNIVPLIAMLGIAAMVIAVRTGDASLTEKFAESQGLSIITGAGMVIGSFVSGGTATPNFARFAKTPKAAVWTTIIAFFLGNSLMFCFGAFSGVYVGGNDIFEVMIALEPHAVRRHRTGTEYLDHQRQRVVFRRTWPLQYYKNKEKPAGSHFRRAGYHHRYLAL